MARKWREFFNFLQSFVLRLWGWLAGRGRRRVAWVLGLGALVLVLTSSPGLAQLAGQSQPPGSDARSNQIEREVRGLYDSGQYSEAVRTLEAAVDRETNSRYRAILQVNLGRLYSELGRQVQACRNLRSAFGIQAEVCEGADLGEGTSWVTGPLSYEDETQAKSMRIFGDVLRGVGELNTSRKVLETALEITKKLYETEGSKPKEEIRTALFLSLGNTYRALGDLERDRVSFSQYEYLPWKFTKRIHFSEINPFVDADNLYKCSWISYNVVSNSIPPQLLSPCLQDRSESRISNIRDGNLETDYYEMLLAHSNSLTVSIKRLELPLNNEEIGDIVANSKLLSEEISDEINDSYYGLGSLEDDCQLTVQQKQKLISAGINLAESLTYLSQIDRITGEPIQNVTTTEKTTSSMNQIPIIELPETAIANLFDRLSRLSSCLPEDLVKRSDSVISGNLGGFYEYLYSSKGVVDLKTEAKQKTLEALYTLQSEDAPDIAYQWHWQMGRLLNLEFKEQEAISEYQAAISSLEYARKNVRVVNSDFQYSFRDNVEPAYRELIDLLTKSITDKEENIEQAHSLIQGLQIAELEIFLQCKIAQDSNVDLNSRIDEDSSALAIYPIILKDRIEIIFKRHGEKLDRIANPVKEEYLTVEKDLNKFRRLLEEAGFGAEDKELARKIFQWIIKPLEVQGVLEKEDTPEKTIIFVLDGSLRNIPLSALYDYEENRPKEGIFLIEKYNLSISVGSDISPKNEDSRKLTALIAGQSQEVEADNRTLGALPGVKEVENIVSILKESGVESIKILLDNDLNKNSLEAALNSFPYSIVHLATHGQFSSNPSETYIIPSSNEKLDLNDLSNIFQRNPDETIELLVLSACETAKGDNRSILGLAGITVKAGVRSTLGGLWSVSDDTTPYFMEKFYGEISKGEVTKTQALRQAQLTLLKEGYEPEYWAPFILVGDWKTTMKA